LRHRAFWPPLLAVPASSLSRPSSLSGLLRTGGLRAVVFFAVRQTYAPGLFAVPVALRHRPSSPTRCPARRRPLGRTGHPAVAISSTARSRDNSSGRHPPQRACGPIVTYGRNGPSAARRRPDSGRHRARGEVRRRCRNDAASRGEQGNASSIVTAKAGPHSRGCASRSSLQERPNRPFAATISSPVSGSAPTVRAVAGSAEPARGRFQDIHGLEQRGGPRLVRGFGRLAELNVGPKRPALTITAYRHRSLRAAVRGGCSNSSAAAPR